jgi:hypothetical protein
MIDEKETLQLNPEMPLIMFNRGFIEHLLLIIFNRLQLFWRRKGVWSDQIELLLRGRSNPHT